MISVIEVQNISKVYERRRLFGLLKGKGEKSQALSGVSFSVAKGETVGLLGPNGAGKTTILKIIATMLYPSSGRVLFHGHDLIEDPVRARKEMGLVTCDERSFYWRLTGRHNLNFFAILYGIPKKVAEERIANLLGVLGLSHAADNPFHSYSSGMKQKLAIARGLLSDPRIVLYDEPTRSLDPLSAQNIRSWIVEHRKKSPEAVHLIATNLLHEAEQLCDRVLIINRGKIIAHGTINDIRREWHGREYAVHRITCSGLKVHSLRPLPEEGLLEITEEPDEEGTERLMIRARTVGEGRGFSSLLGQILRAGGAVLRCETEEVSFDEVFCSLVSRDRAAQKASEETIT